MPIIISIAFAKGGASKTTLAWALASILSREHRTLAIDMDSQGSLTAALCADPPALTIYDVLMRRRIITEAALPAAPVYGPYLQVIGASALLSGIEAESAGRFDRQFLVKDVLENLQGFDFIIFDCPSSQGILTVAPLTASDFVLSPVATEPASMEQVEAFKRTVELVQRRMNPRLIWLPLLPSLYQRTQLDQEVLAALRDRHAVFPTVIRRTVRLREAMAAQTPCSNPDYLNFTQRLIERIEHEKKTVHAPRGAEGGATPPR